MGFICNIINGNVFIGPKTTNNNNDIHAVNVYTSTADTDISSVRFMNNQCISHESGPKILKTVSSEYETGGPALITMNNVGFNERMLGEAQITEMKEVLAESGLI